jgi:hypothetical protein
VRELRCTGDLRTLIDIGIVRQDASVLNRCHGLLFDSLNVFVRMCGETHELAREADLSVLVQTAETLGYWTLGFIPGMMSGITTTGGNEFCTPPNQIFPR